MEGTYILIIKLNGTIKVNHKGKLYTLPSGIYLYVGSALGSPKAFEHRILRHFRKNKKVHWHIDKITSSALSIIHSIIFLKSKERLECKVSQLLNNSEFCEVPIPNFGSTDCKSGCPAHFYRCKVQDSDLCVRLSIAAIRKSISYNLYLCTVRNSNLECKIINT